MYGQCPYRWHTVPVDADRLFPHILDDLERRTTATDEYEVLMSAALLRKLLLDGEPLTNMDTEYEYYQTDSTFAV